MRASGRDVRRSRRRGILTAMHRKRLRPALLATTGILVLAAASCARYPAAARTTSTTTTTTVPLLCRARPCASAAAVQRLLAVAQGGASRSFVATYMFVGAKGAPRTFSYATAPGKGVLSYFPPPAKYLYEVVADGLRYEFISNRSGYFECLTKVAEPAWSCRGPVPLASPGLGRAATVGAYDVVPDLLDYLGPPLGRDPVTTRVVNGLHLSCVSYTQGTYPDTWTWCVTRSGVLAYLSGPSFLRAIELVRLRPGVPEGEFSLPARPAKWQGFEAEKVPAFLPPGLMNAGPGRSARPLQPT